MISKNPLIYFLSWMFICFCPGKLFAQQELNMEDAINMAMTNHPVARTAALSAQKDLLMRKQSVELPPVQAKYWQRNANAGNDRLWSVTQDFGSIPEHIRKSKYHRSLAEANQAGRVLELDELKRQVKSAYFDLVYHYEKLQVMKDHDPYFEALIQTAEIYLASDSIDELVKVSAGVNYAAYQRRMFIAGEELNRAGNRLRSLLYFEGEIVPEKKELELYQIHPDKDPELRFEPVKHKEADDRQLEVMKSAVALNKSKFFPSVHAGYINQYLAGIDHYHGWMVGLSVPLWIRPVSARVKQAEIDLQTATIETEYRQFSDLQHIETLKSLLNEYFVQISFSKENLLEEAKLILQKVEEDFSSAGIKDYAGTFSKIHHAVSAKLDHLEYINLYNQTALELEYYTQ